MRNLNLKIAAFMLFASISSIVAQNQTKPQIKKTEAKKVYTFKTMKEKEMKAKAAYKKLTFNLKDTSYPKDLLEIEKREMICIILGKVSEEKTS